MSNTNVTARRRRRGGAVTLLGNTALLTVLLGAAMSMSLPAQAQQTPAPQAGSAAPAGDVDFSVPAGALESALLSFGRQAGLRLVYASALTDGKRTGGASGRMPRGTALARLLEGSGLIFTFTSADSVRIEPVSASASGGSLQLNPITVEGQGRAETGRGPVEGYVATRSAIGTKTDTPLIETPQSISVVTRDQMVEQGAQRIEQALSYTPGVVVGSYGSNPEQDYVFSRGFHVPLFLDGIRQERDYITGAQLGVEPYGLELLEVARGPSSVLYGQIAPGGMVNLSVKRPTEDPFREIEVQAGNHDRFQGAFDLSGPADKDGILLYRLTGLTRDADGQMDFQRDDRMFLAPSLTWRPGEDTTLTLLTHFQRDEGALRPVPLPAFGTLYGNPNGKLPSERFLGEPGFDDFEREQYAVGYEIEHRFDKVWTARQNLRFSHVDQVEKFTLTAFDYGSFPTDYRTVDRTGWDDRNTLQTLGVDNQVQAKFATGSISHTLLMGLDYRHSTDDWTFYSVDMAPIDAYDPQYGSPLGASVLGIDQQQQLRQIGLYVQDQISLGRWRFTLGGRQDWAKSTTQDKLWGGEAGQTDDKFTGRAGVTYLFDNGIAPYASYSTSFDPEVGLDSAGQPFKPTTAEQVEIGVKYQPWGYDSFIAASVFELTRQNILTRDPNPPASNPWAQIQTGEARIRGFELEGKASLKNGLDLVAAYTYFDSEITESNGADLGMPMYFTPEQQFSLWGDYTIQHGPLAGFGFGAGVRYRSSAWGLSYEIEVPSYTLYDAALHYDLGRLDPQLDGAAISVNARNLFDKEYVSNCSFYEGCYYGDRRMVFATLRYRW